jgi:Zn-dependent protease with chaperone function
VRQLIIFIILKYALPNLYAQDDAALLLVRDQVQAGFTKFEARPDLNKKQNLLLKERVKEKVDHELELLDKRSIILSGELYDYVNLIFKKLLDANPEIPSNTKLIIYRSTSFNAFTLGDHVIFVQAGLLSALKNSSEIALVLAHEIAHNTLAHVDISMVRSIREQTNDTLKKEIKNILKGDVGQVSALNKLLVPRLAESREQSRINEHAADSLGMEYILKAGFQAAKALSMFRVMEQQSSHAGEKVGLTELLGSDIPESLREKISSYSRDGSLGAVELKDKRKNYLATHPYERDRFHRLVKQSGLKDTTFFNYQSVQEPEFEQVLPLVSREMIHSAFLERDLTNALYISGRHVSLYPEDQSGYKMLSLNFSALGFLKERRVAGKYISRQNPRQPEDFDRFCALSFAITPSECQHLAERFASSKTSIQDEDNSPEAYLLALIKMHSASDLSAFEKLWSATEQKIRSSHMGWLLEEIETYLTFSKNPKFLKTKK